MGIRVNKAIGYGVTDFEGMEDDDRILEDDFRRSYREPSKQDFFDFLEENREHLVEMEAEETGRDVLEDDEGEPMSVWTNYHLDKLEDQRWSPADSITWRPEYGDESVLLFQPPGLERWSRYDDPIDYIEETEFQDQTNRVEELDRAGITPFDHWYRIKDSMPEELMERISHFDEDETLVEAGAVHQLKRLRDKLESEPIEEFLRHIRPEIPYPILTLLEFYDGLDTERFRTELRPLFYVYWA